MSSSVCQGLQSCLELRFLDSRVLKPKLAPPVTICSLAEPCFTVSAPTEPKPSPNNEEKNTTLANNNVAKANDYRFDMGGWSFLQSLANAKDNLKDKVVYVHPLVKRSVSILSEKSLEMCTESLGSETGSQLSETSDDISLVSLEIASKPKENVAVSRKMSRSSGFPPPLTSITGSHGVHVRSYREEGRLLLEAVSVPRFHSHFHAERGEGRLRLSLLKDATLNSDCEEEEQEQEQEEVKDNEHGEVLGGEEESYWGEDMEGNSSNVGAEMGTGKMLAMPTSCKESGRGHKGLMNLETSFWVAT